MNDDVSGEFSEDEFEVSAQMADIPKKKETKYSNREYDEGFEVSQDFSVAESFDGRNDAKGQGNNARKEKQLKNDKYDEAVEISQSLDPEAFHAAAPKMGMNTGATAAATAGAKMSSVGNTSSSSKSTTVKDKHYDEEVDFSNSGDDDVSVDTRHSADNRAMRTVVGAANAPGGSNRSSADTAMAQQQMQMQKPQAVNPGAGSAVQQQQQMQAGKSSVHGGADSAAQGNAGIQAKAQATAASQESSSESEDPADGSYDQIDGGYNPKDYANLQVPLEVKELFQYIERYKPQEVELNTMLRCFVPEYIPAIGEMDSFIKIPRPDGAEDDLGLKVIDEPAAYQSDPVILELQLRAGIKRSQLGEVSVRSVENAAKNTGAIDTWINSIKETHRIKPPPQVHYRKSMPDIEALMDQWPEDFEQFLNNAAISAASNAANSGLYNNTSSSSGPDSILPSPDLDLTLAEYVKVLCSLLDIPVYDNPIESLHVMFTLYQEFRENPHFQARLAEDDPNSMVDRAKAANEQNNYGNADVLSF